jgi:hypothetical protein
MYNSFRDFVKKLFGFSDCSSHDSEISSLKIRVRDLNKSLKSSVSDYVSLEKELVKATEEVKLVNKDLSDYRVSSTMEDYWNTKYPRAIVEFKGRSLPFSKVLIGSPVTVFLTPTDPFIRLDLEKWKLLDTIEDAETLIPKIYKKIFKLYYKYTSDEAVWRAPEVFEFPFEMRARDFRKGFDCDSWSHFQVSYYLAAGVPSWRVRVVCGHTSGGFGHSTVYVYSLKTHKWHHINSTYGPHNHTYVRRFPTHESARNGGDASGCGITKVWFSFNDKSAFYDFDSSTSPEVIKAVKKFSIVRVDG